jgi:hypothetical protein
VGFATEEQAAAIFAELKRSDAEREAAMPDWQAALHQICRAKERLRDLGWREAVYCPKDGTDFGLVEWGSTGVFTGFYTGEWPDGHIVYEDYVGHPEGMMFKPLADLTEAEETARQASMRSTHEFIDRMGRLAADPT